MPNEDEQYDYSCPDHGTTFDLVAEDGITDRYYSLGKDLVLLLERVDRPIPYLDSKNITENITDWQYVVSAYKTENMTFAVMPVKTDWKGFDDGTDS